MHILFLTDNFPPEVNAPANRTFEHCREWVDAGHKVTVITCAPNFPRGVVFDGYRNRWFARETMAGVDVIRVWTYITANEGFIRRTIDYASYLHAVLPAVFNVRGVDIIVATSPQLFTPLAGRIASRIKGCPYVFELRDLWPESIRAVGAMKSSRLINALERLELSLYRHAAAIVSVTEAFVDNLAGRGIEREKIHVITNGADLSRFSPRPRDRSLAQRHGLEDKFVCGYVGTHGMAHGLGTLLDAARLLADDPTMSHVQFLFLGHGADKGALIAKAQDLGLSNVLFVDSVPREDVSAYWSLLDASIIHLRNTPLFETVIPSKLFECMAMGIPVLHGVSGESAGIVERVGNGIVFEPENAMALADGVRRFALDGDLRRRYSENGSSAAHTYDRKVLAMNMLAVLEDVVVRHATETDTGSDAKAADRTDPTGRS